MIIIIGAGLAGLACARTLQRAGRTDFLLLEKSDVPGGRLRTTVTSRGYHLDHGFQVMLDSYAAIGRFCDWASLRTGRFESGAVLVDGRQEWEIDHPFSAGTQLARTVCSNAITTRDKMKLAVLTAGLLRTRDSQLLQTAGAERDISTRQYLRELGFSERAVRRFFQPFFGGVFLDEHLETSASLFRYYLKKFAYGEAHLPAEGIAAFPRAISAQLDPDALRYSTVVTGLDCENSKAVRIRTETGEPIAVEAVVLATDRDQASCLLGADRVEAASWRKVTSLWFRSFEPLTDSRKLLLVSGRRRLIRHFAQVTNVQPALTPDGTHLLHATVLDDSDASDDILFAEGVRELSQIFPMAPTLLEPLRVIRVPKAVPAQAAGFAKAFARRSTWLPRNVWLAGDQNAPASIETALISGERAAESLLRYLASGSELDG